MKTPFKIFQAKERQRKNEIKQNFIKMKPFNSKQFQCPSTILIESFNKDEIISKPYNKLARKSLKSSVSSQRQAKSERIKNNRNLYQQKKFEGNKQVRFQKTSYGKKLNIRSQYHSQKFKQVKSQLQEDSCITQEVDFPTYNQFKQQFQLQNKSVNLEDFRGKRIHSTVDNFITLSTQNKRSSENTSTLNKLQIFQTSTKQFNTLNCQQMHLKEKKDFIKYYLEQIGKEAQQKEQKQIKNDLMLTNFIKASRKKRVFIQKTFLRSNQPAQIVSKRTISSPPSKTKRYYQKLKNKKIQETLDQPLRGWDNQRQEFVFQIL